MNIEDKKISVIVIDDEGNPYTKILALKELTDAQVISILDYDDDSSTLSNGVRDYLLKKINR